MTVAEAKGKRVCRICGEAISVTAVPLSWTEDYGEMTWPIAVTLNFGEEFAHTACLNPKRGNAPS